MEPEKKKWNVYEIYHQLVCRDHPSRFDYMREDFLYGADTLDEILKIEEKNYQKLIDEDEYGKLLTKLENVERFEQPDEEDLDPGNDDCCFWIIPAEDTPRRRVFISYLIPFTHYAVRNSDYQESESDSSPILAL